MIIASLQGKIKLFFYIHRREGEAPKLLVKKKINHEECIPFKEILLNNQV